MSNHFKCIHEGNQSHLLGFDTFLERCLGQGLVRLSPRSIAYQRSHPLKKRR